MNTPDYRCERGDQQTLSWTTVMDRSLPPDERWRHEDFNAVWNQEGSDPLLFLITEYQQVGRTLISRPVCQTRHIGYLLARRYTNTWRDSQKRYCHATYLHIERLLVLPEWRRQGFATRLFEATVQAAAPLNAISLIASEYLTGLHLWCASQNIRMAGKAMPCERNDAFQEYYFERLLKTQSTKQEGVC